MADSGLKYLSTDVLRENAVGGPSMRRSALATCLGRCSRVCGRRIRLRHDVAPSPHPARDAGALRPPGRVQPMRHAESRSCSASSSRIASSLTLASPPPPDPRSYTASMTLTISERDGGTGGPSRLRRDGARLQHLAWPRRSRLMTAPRSPQSRESCREPVVRRGAPSPGAWGGWGHPEAGGQIHAADLAAHHRWPGQRRTLTFDVPVPCRAAVAMPERTGARGWRPLLRLAVARLFVIHGVTRDIVGARFDALRRHSVRDVHELQPAAGREAAAPGPQPLRATADCPTVFGLGGLAPVAGRPGCRCGGVAGNPACIAMVHGREGWFAPSARAPARDGSEYSAPAIRRCLIVAALTDALSFRLAGDGRAKPTRLPGPAAPPSSPPPRRLPGLRYECRWSPRNTTTSPGDRCDCSPATASRISPDSQVRYSRVPGMWGTPGMRPPGGISMRSITTPGMGSGSSLRTSAVALLVLGQRLPRVEPRARPRGGGQLLERHLQRDRHLVQHGQGGVPAPGLEVAPGGARHAGQPRHLLLGQAPRLAQLADVPARRTASSSLMPADSRPPIHWQPRW